MTRRPIRSIRGAHFTGVCHASHRGTTDRETGQDAVAGQPIEDRHEGARNGYTIERMAVKDVSRASSQGRRRTRDTEGASEPGRNAFLDRRLLRRGRR